MKQNVFASVVCIGLALSALLFVRNSHAMGKPVPAKTGNHCKDQALEYLIRKFGPETKIIRTNAFPNGSKSWIYWITTNLCDGQFVFTYSVNGIEDCKQVHYGSVPHYLNTVYATEGCQEHLPHPDQTPL